MATATILDVPEIRAQVYRWTVPDYRALAEDNPAFHRAELIRGIIVQKMSKTPLHDYLVASIAQLFRETLEPGWVVRQEASLVLADSVPEPDVAVVRGEARDFRRAHPTTAALVVEIAVTSLAADREKAALYAEAGVGEYWIVLAEAEQVEVHRRLDGGVYTEVRVYGRNATVADVAVLGGADVAVEALFA